MINKEGLKTALLLIKNRQSLIAKDLEALINVKKLLGDGAIPSKYTTLVDIKCELTLLYCEISDLMDDD